MKFKKYSMNELKEALIKLDPKIITADTCSTLLPFCPEAEEIQICKGFDGDLGDLDNVTVRILFLDPFRPANI